MPRYSYNNIIIIVTNVIILEFLFVRFVPPSALLPFYLFFNMSLKTGITKASKLLINDSFWLQ